MGRATSSLVEELRRLARDLYPRHIDELGLNAALRSLVREASAGTDRELAYSFSGALASAPELPRDVTGALYDVVCEALRNAKRHSGARCIDVSFGIEWHHARVRITDDGCGFDAAALDPTRGVGLSLIRERIALVGGTLEIHTSPGKGTQIGAIVPFVPQRSSYPHMPSERVHRWQAI